jgi:hypothetical protein
MIEFYMRSWQLVKGAVGCVSTANVLINVLAFITIGASMVRKAQVPRIVMTRMPDGLHTRLRREAKRNSRSVNAEIVRRLIDTFDQADEEVEFRRRVDAAAETAARKIAAALGPAVLERLETVIAEEREIYESPFKDEPGSDGSGK